MLEVDIEKIVPVTDARDALNKIVDEVSGSDTMYVLTVNGKPSAVVVGVHHLEKLTGKSEGSFIATPTDSPVDVPLESSTQEQPTPAPVSFNPMDSMPPTPSAAPVETTTFSDPTLPPVTPTAAPVEPTPVQGNPVTFVQDPSVTPSTGDQFVTPSTDDLGAAPAPAQGQAADDLFN
jgi:prevent-host-death family protein